MGNVTELKFFIFSENHYSVESTPQSDFPGRVARTLQDPGRQDRALRIQLISHISSVTCFVLFLFYLFIYLFFVCFLFFLLIFFFSLTFLFSHSTGNNPQI